MSDLTIAVKVARRCYVTADRIAEPGDIVTLSVPQAANLLAGGGVAVDPVAAKAAIDAWNVSVHRQALASQPRGAPAPFALGGGRWH